MPNANRLAQYLAADKREYLEAAMRAAVCRSKPPDA
jgi:hypothetical protein